MVEVSRKKPQYFFNRFGLENEVGKTIGEATKWLKKYEQERIKINVCIVDAV